MKGSRMKKGLSFLLSFVMLFAAFSVTALADEADDLAEAQEAQAAFEEAYDEDSGTVVDGWQTIYNAVLPYLDCLTAAGGTMVSDDEYVAAVEELTSYYEGITILNMADENIEDVYGFTDLGVLAPFTGLKELYLSNTGIADDVDAVALGALVNMLDLEVLDISGNSGITDLGAIVDLPLVTLNLQGTAIEEFGPLTMNDDPEPAIANSLEYLDISDTNIIKIEDVWDYDDDKLALPNLATLIANDLALESISGLCEIVDNDELVPEDVTWDLTGSTITNTADNVEHLLRIRTAFGEEEGFTAPTLTGVAEGMEDIVETLYEAQQAQEAFEDAYQAGGTVEGGWQTIYDAVLPYLTCLSAASDSMSGNTFFTNAVEELTEYYAGITELDMTGENIGEVYGFTDLGVLAPFTGLETLILDDTGIADTGDPYTAGEGNTAALGALAGMTGLETLDINNNPGITHLGALENLTSLTTLYAGGTGIDDRALGAIDALSLTALELWGTDITTFGQLTTNADPEPAIASSLEYLNISDTNIIKIEDVWDEFDQKAALPNLKTFYAEDLLNLTSISGLMELVENSATTSVLEWNLGGSVLIPDGEGHNAAHVEAISASLGDKFIPPTIQTEHTITATAGNGGSITPSGTITVKTGESQTFTFAPNANSTFWISDVEVDGVSQGRIDSYTFENVRGDHTIEVSFRRTSTATGSGSGGSGGGSSSSTTYDVDRVSTDNGSFSLSDSSASRNETITITARPDDGYVVDEVIVTDEDGNEITVRDGDDENEFTFRMPRGDVSVEVTFREDETAAEDEEEITETPVTALPFIDVTDNDWFKEAVEYVYERGLMNGISSNQFGPSMNTTRGMIVTILYRLEGSPTGAGRAPFADVAADAYYADAVAWASVNNIASGYDALTFGPENNITREELASILYRYAMYKGMNTAASGNLTGFLDNGSVSGWANTAMSWAVDNGILSGRGNNMLAPQENATRAEVASILMRYCENLM